MSRTVNTLVFVAALLAAAAIAAVPTFAKGAIDEFKLFQDPKHRAENRGPDATLGGNAYVAQILGAPFHNNTYGAGQEVRLLIASRFAINLTAEVINRRKALTVNNAQIGRAQLKGPRDVPLSGRSLSGLLRFKNQTLFPGFNSTGSQAVRVRIIAAHSSRTTTTGAVMSCGAGASHDVWAEFWGMAPRNLAFGRQIVFSGFVTFTVPPFNFRWCVKDVQRRNDTKSGMVTDAGVNAGWQEFLNMPNQFARFHEPVLLWKAPGTSFEVGDYAAIEILANPTAKRFVGIGSRYVFNISSFSLQDNVKLVKFGYPCSYEKEDSRADQTLNLLSTRDDQYCGANNLHAVSGDWANTNCIKEGSVAGGVAHVGERSVNPLASDSTTYAPSSFFNKRTDRQHLVAYMKLPALGEYDICVSTRMWRRTSYEMSRKSDSLGLAANAQPVWIKAYDASSSACDAIRGYDTISVHVASCQPRRSAFTVVAATNQVTWTTTDDTPATWGEIKFTTTSGTLNYGAATQWAHSAVRDYYNLTNGDVFRLVPESFFSETTTATTGEMTGNKIVTTAATLRTTTTATVAKVSSTAAGLLSTAGVGKFQQYEFLPPGQGSANTVGIGSGCFWQGSDNYGANGLFGNPGTQCCTTPPCSSTRWCALTDSDNEGPTASADLGGNPRIGYSPWRLDGTGTDAWAYIRFPAAGKYRVCYRRAGGNWRVIAGTSSIHTTSNITFATRKLNAGYTYHLNDTRADTWGPLTIRSLGGNRLDKQAWNYYTASSATAVGSALKIVLTTENCYVSTAQSRTFSMNPGSMEAPNALGSADDSTTAVSQVYFYVKVPAFSSTLRYRICFRKAAENWHALSDPNFVAHTYMTASNAFGPRLAPSLTYTLTDSQTGSWGKFIFNRSSTATQSFNADFRQGDMVRLVPNVTVTGVEVGCDIVYDTASVVTDLKFLSQKFDATRTDADVDVACAVESSVSTDLCYTSRLKPTSNSIVATTPYTTIAVGANPSGVGLLDGSVAFIAIPTGVTTLGSTVARPVGFKVCYKQARFTNWIEASGATQGTRLTVTTARTTTYTTATSPVIAGTYSYLTLTATTAFPITYRYDLVKLVPFAATCEAPVVTNAGYELYSAISGTEQSVQCLTTTAAPSTCVTSTVTTGTTARAYMTFPTVPGSKGDLTNYRVCYMARSSDVATSNWIDLSGTTPLVVKNSGIVYTVLAKPYALGMTTIRFMSGSTLLDTRPGQDNAKVVNINARCADATGSTVQPSSATSASTHVGSEITNTSTSSTLGWTDVGPTDAWPTREAQIDVVLPSTSSYKVCYRPVWGLWTEVLQATGSDRVYAQTTSYIVPTTSEVSKFTMNAILTGSFSNTPNYYTLPWSTVAVGGASTSDGTSHYFTMTYTTTQTAGRANRVKFVRAFSEYPAGTYSWVSGASCLSAGIEYAYTTTAVTVENIDINLPLENGKFIVCLYSAATGTWYQVPADTSPTTVSQPVPIIQSNLEFSVTGTSTLTILDNNQQNSSSFGGLAALDYVYLINASTTVAACGSVADWQSIARDTAKTNLSTAIHGVDTVNFLAARLSTVVLPATPRTGAYAVCLFRSQAAATNTTGFPPFIRSNWYQIRNGGTASGAKTNFFVLSGATKLNITGGCPAYNMSRRIRSGQSFEVTVQSENAASEAVTYTAGTPRADVTAVGSGFALQSGNGECTPASAPVYGYDSAALTQFMTDGKVKFTLSAMSACPSSGCVVGFSSGAGLTSSASCRFDVLPTTVAAVQIVASPTSCNMGDWCTFRAVALHSDGGIAYTINSGVTFTSSMSSATTSDAQMLPSLSGFSVSGGSSSFTNGVIDFRVRFRPSQYSASSSETVTLFATANGKVSATVSFTVYRPILSAIHVVDIFPVATPGAPILPLQPTWEPTTSFRGVDTVSLGTNNIVAGTNFHLVAAQAYNVVFRAVVTTNGVVSYSVYDQVVPATFKVSLDTTWQTAITAAGNAVLVGSAATESDVTVLPTIDWAQSATMLTVSLRLKNAIGCDQGCTIPFAFTTGHTASITTPVRSIATRLQVRCATTLAGATTVNTCTGVQSVPNRGWYLNVSAVDDFGTVDRYFDGDVVAVLSSDSQTVATARGVGLTTVAALQANQARTNFVRVSAASGWAVFSGLTVSKPCPPGVCELQLLSTWGTDVTVAGSLVATANTQQLRATLDTVLPFCTTTSSTDCAAIAGISLANTSHLHSLIYRDTRVCVNVEAVDSTGLSTLYETNWVLYYARDETSGSSAQALTLTDENSNTGFVQRYKAMVNSRVRFCFTISGFTDHRQVMLRFAAQRFGTAGTYWSQGSTGTAAVGPLGVYARKLVAAVLLSGATNADVVTAGKTGVVSAAYTGTTLNVGLNFILKDHFNNTVAPAEMVDAEKAKFLKLRATSASLPNNGEVTVLGDERVRGKTNATLVPSGSTLNVTASTIAAAVNFDSACLGCTIKFDLVDAGGITVGLQTTTNGVTEFLGANVTMYIVNTDATAVRRLAYNPGTNPYSYWVNGSTSSNLLLTTNTAPTYHYTSCFLTTCRPYPSTMNLNWCDARQAATTFGRSATLPLQMRVYVMPSTQALTDTSEPVDWRSQVDILNTYTVSVSIGNQLLTCVSACTSGDGTVAPSITLAAYGSSVRAAVGAFAGVSDSSIRQAAFLLRGVSASNYVSLNWTTNKLDSIPSVGGAYAATATGSAAVVGITFAQGAGFYWRPADDAYSMAVLSTALDADACNNTASFACSGGTGCSTTGLAQSGSVSTGVAFTYSAQTIPTGVAFPMTVEVYDWNGYRVVGASGSVSVSVNSWSGCNNGGLPTFTGTLAQGRATIWMTFTRACQACVLRFTVTPSNAGLFNWMLANPSTLSTLSAPVTVTSVTPPAVQVVATAATPATLLTSTATALTVATATTVTLTPRALVGRIPVEVTNTPYTASVYSTVAVSQNWWWMGNGGVLRSTLAGTLNSHYQIVSGAGVMTPTTLTAYFTRTCTACKLGVAYSVNGGSTVTFDLPSTITVTTQASSMTLVGWAPRAVRANTPIAVALWSTGSENAATVPVAGVAPPTTVGSAATPTVAATNATNGDGGDLYSEAWVFNTTQIHRMWFNGPCDTCTVSLGGNSFRVRIFTTATYLKPSAEVTLSAAEQLLGVGRTATTVNMNEWRVVPLQAIDDDGFVDQSLGVRSCDFPAKRFFCLDAPVSISSALTSDGMSGGFPVSDVNMVFADATGMTVSTNSVMYFGRAGYNMSFQLPQRQVIPVFSAAGLSSALGFNRQFQVPKYSVSVGTSGLSLSVISATTTTLLTQKVANVFHVALVGSVTSAPTKKFVAVEANNLVSMTVAAGCPAYTVSVSGAAAGATSTRLVAGYATFTVTFTETTATGATCGVTFTASTGTGAGTGTCTNAAACTVLQTVTVSPLTVSRWSLLRPTATDLATSSRMFAHVGRSLRVRTRVFGLEALGGSEVPVVNATSQLTVTSSDCGFVSAQASITANTADAEVSLLIADSGLTSCTLTVTMTGPTGLALIGPDRTTTSATFVVTLCKTTTLQLLTNVTSAYRGVMLKTGVPYEFYAVMLTATGQQCVGDSQDEGTNLTIAAVHGANTSTISNLAAVNVNSTATSTAAFLRGNVADEARTFAQVVGGAFKFQVVFTNSSVGLGLTRGVRLRVTSSSLAQTVYSGAFDTVIAASRLRFGLFRLPFDVVTSRKIFTGPNGKTELDVFAVDPLPESWQARGLMSGPPNVARRTSEFGNNAEVFWRVSPAPSATAAFPLTFGNGAAAISQVMTNGRTVWPSIAWNAADGLYGLKVVSVMPGIEDTAELAISVQTARALWMDTRNFTVTSSATCSANCLLPNGTFTTKRNATINNNNPFLSIDSLKSFNLTILLSDNTLPLKGDNASVIAVNLISGAGSSVQLAMPPAYEKRGTLYARVEQGRATFQLGFLGDTLLAGGVEELASLVFSCPATRPKELLEPWEDAANPCVLTSTLTTQKFQVVDVKARSDVLNSAAVTNAKKVLKVGHGFSAYTSFNRTLFATRLAIALQQRGIGYLTPTNIPKVLAVTSCTVGTIFPADGDLGSTVCGPNGLCAAPSGLSTCPNGVQACGCPTSTSRILILNRYLLQNSTNSSSSSVKSEMTFALNNADGFPARTVDEVVAEYGRVYAAALDALRNDAELRNAFQILTVSERSAIFVVTAIPPTTSAPTPTTTASAPTPTVDSAQSVAFALALLLGALLALFA
jgi:hypothetical protein